MLSIINRWHALGGVGKRKNDWMSRLDNRMAQLAALVDDGADLYRYEDLTDCETGSHWLGIMAMRLRTSCLLTDQRYNAFPKRFKKLPEWAEPIAARIQKDYDRWHEIYRVGRILDT